jgi:Zn-dependent M28 family amino/carboxypeptidase
MDGLEKNHPKEIQKIKLNIDTDMIASPNYVRGVWIGDEIKDVGTRKKTRSIHNVFRKYFESLGLPIFKFEFNGRSDFQPFIDHGVPAGGVITGEDEIKSVESAILFGGISGMVLDRIFLLISLLSFGV